MNHHHFHRSLLDTTTATTTVAAITTAAATITTYGSVHPPPSSPPKSAHPSVSDIFQRVILISLFATVAIWANHEASKGFSITILNDAGKHSLAGKRFSVFYESNDKATRILLNTSTFVENLLYPNYQDMQHTKKQINSVTLVLASTHVSSIVSVESQKTHDYTITLSPILLETSYHNDDIVLAVLQGMARVWLWDGNGAAPPVLMNGIVEYITTLAGFRSTEVLNSGGGATMSPENGELCWKDEDPRKVAGFLRFYDHQRKQPPGGGGGGGEVVRRLNNGMRNGWHDWMMDDAVGMAGQHACASYDILTRHHNPSSEI